MGGGVLVVILLVLLLRACLDSRSDRAVRDYANSSAALVKESNAQSDALFRLLEGSGGPNQAVDAQNTVNGFRVQSAQIVDRARDLDVPGDASTAHRYLLDTLEFRRDGLARIATAPCPTRWATLPGVRDPRAWPGRCRCSSQAT